MARYTWIVFTKALEGRDDEFNAWYQNEHLPHLVDVPGIRSAQRYKLAAGLTPDSFPYLAIYEIETDDLSKVLAELKARSGTAKLNLSEALDLKNMYSAIYDEFGERVTA